MSCLCFIFSVPLPRNPPSSATSFADSVLFRSPSRSRTAGDRRCCAVARPRPRPAPAVRPAARTGRTPRSSRRPPGRLLSRRNRTAPCRSDRLRLRHPRPRQHPTPPPPRPTHRLPPLPTPPRHPHPPHPPPPQPPPPPPPPPPHNTPPPPPAPNAPTH